MLALTTPPKVPYPTRYVIDPVAFFAALISVPLLFTALTFAPFFIPVAALFGLSGVQSHGVCPDPRCCPRSHHW